MIARSCDRETSLTMRLAADIPIGVLMVLATATFGATGAPGAATMTIPEWETLWSSVLARYVDDAGRIDFAALSHDHADLDRVVAFVAAVDPVSEPQRFPDRAARIGFYINAYNALAMHGIVETGVPRSLGGVTKFTFFNVKKFTVGGKSISLYDLENDVIRPLGEERVHFALNCMAVSCPRLPRTAFTADALEQHLDTATRTFLAEKRNVSVDPVKRKRVADENIPFAIAVAEDMFCEPAKGAVDFVAFRDVLREIDYRGWAIVEQDMYPAPFDKPLPIAKRTRAYLREIGIG